MKGDPNQSDSSGFKASIHRALRPIPAEASGVTRRRDRTCAPAIRGSSEIRRRVADRLSSEVLPRYRRNSRVVDRGGFDNGLGVSGKSRDRSCRIIKSADLRLTVCRPDWRTRGLSHRFLTSFHRLYPFAVMRSLADVHRNQIASSKTVARDLDCVTIVMA